MISELFQDNEFKSKLSQSIQSHYPNYGIVEKQCFLMANESAQSTFQISGVLYFRNHLESLASTFGAPLVDKIRHEMAYVKNISKQSDERSATSSTTFLLRCVNPASRNCL